MSPRTFLSTWDTHYSLGGNEKDYAQQTRYRLLPGIL